MRHRPERRAVRGGVLVLVLAAVLCVPSLAAAAAGAPSGNGVQPVEFAGNLENADCPTGTFALTVQSGDLGNNPHTLGGFSVTTTTSSTASGDVVAFTANMGVDVVYVKGGPNTNVYTYAPEASSDTGLHAPVNPSNGSYYGISHVTFCFDYELQVTKTAQTSFDRDYDWSIEKKNDAGTDPVELAPGQQYTVNYEVKVTAGAPVDSNWAVTGTIDVHNPAPVTASGVSVSDVIKLTGEADVGATVVCPATTIAAGATMQCTYSASLPDGRSRTNHATATTTTTGIGSGTGTAPVTFGSPSTTTGACIDVSDDREGVLGTVCVADSPKTFAYSETFGPYPNVCAQHTIVNTASFTADDGQTGSAQSTVVFDVQCVEEGGCTLTQGYWKTHSDRGPAPYDDAWKNLGPLEEDTLFFNTNRTWYQVFWTPPAGNAFYNLAHQYMAAFLNQLNGATVPPAVQTALTQAADLLDNYVGAPPSRVTGATRDQMIQLAGVLGAFNEGTTGPGHCDEDGGSSS